MIRASDVHLSTVPVPPVVQVEQAVYAAIDALLAPAWAERELIEGDADHDHAGRFYDVSALTPAQIDILRGGYCSVGWDVYCGVGRDSVRRLQFIPRALVVKVNDRKWPGR